MRFDIVTIFPGLFDSIFAHGVVKRAIAGGLVDIRTHDLRSFTHDRHRTVDDRPFGGGEGMVLKPGPLAEAIEALAVAPKGLRRPGRETVILLSAQGARFTQPAARQLATLDRVVLLCGRYEGVDERVNEQRQADWFTPIADVAIKAYLADPKADRDTVKRLSAAWVTRADIVTKTAERDKLQQASSALSSSTEETRRNLRAIEKNKTAEPLRQKLTARLAEAATKLDDYNRKIVELDSKLSELTVQFKESIRDVKVILPSPAA